MKSEKAHDPDTSRTVSPHMKLLPIEIISRDFQPLAHPIATGDLAGGDIQEGLFLCETPCLSSEFHVHFARASKC